MSHAELASGPGNMHFQQQIESLIACNRLPQHETGQALVVYASSRKIVHLQEHTPELRPPRNPRTHIAHVHTHGGDSRPL